MDEDEIDLSMFDEPAKSAGGVVSDEEDLSMFDTETLPTGDAKKKSRRFSLPTGELRVTIAVGWFYIRINSIYIGWVRRGR
jgi:hypothetical protein